MKYKDINQKYTELVSKYLAAGYLINSATMSGSQGETASIDLTNGTQIVRLTIKTFYDMDDYLDGVEIVEGRVVESIEPHNEGGRQTIWNDRLDVMSCQRYYEVGENRKTRRKFYGTLEAAKQARKIHYDRWTRNQMSNSKDLTKIGKEIGKRIVREKFKVKRVCECDIKVSKTDRTYIVVYKNNTYRLH